MKIGDKFSCWEVLTEPKEGKVKCKCDCGAIKLVRTYDLTKGRSVMCRQCSAEVANKGHGHSLKGNVTPEYHSYMHMLQRCTNPSNKDYPNYGGRGIKVCEAWKASYEAFFMSMGPKPDPSFTIDRIEHNGNYEPSNCRWASVTDQNRNRRSNIVITYQDETLVLSEWIIKLGLEEQEDALRKRIERGMEPLTSLLKALEKKNG